MKKLLVAADLRPLMMNAMEFLQRGEITVLTASTHDEMLRVHFHQVAHLLVTKLDLPGMACETLVHTIRRSEVMRNVSIVLLAPDTPGHRERGSRCGVNAVLPLPVDPALFAGKVQELLSVAPRRHYRVIMNVAVEGRRNDRPFVCNMENVSASGMLVRTEERLSPGDRITCSFFLPTGKKIGASGEVVRVVDHAANGKQRYGVRFLSLAAEAESSLAAFVESDRRRKQPPAAETTASPPALFA